MELLQGRAGGVGIGGGDGDNNDNGYGDDSIAEEDASEGEFEDFDYKNVSLLTEQNLTALRWAWNAGDGDGTAAAAPPNVNDTQIAMEGEHDDHEMWEEFNRPPDIEALRSLSAASSPQKHRHP